MWGVTESRTQSKETSWAKTWAFWPFFLHSVGHTVVGRNEEMADLTPRLGKSPPSTGILALLPCWGRTECWAVLFHCCILGQWSYCPLCLVNSVAQSCPTLCDPMDCSMPGLPVHHHLPEFTQTHLHWISDAIQSSHSLLSPSPPARNLS